MDELLYYYMEHKKEWEHKDKKELMHESNEKKENFDEDCAKYLVSHMYHVENNKIHRGEAYDIDKAKEIHQKYYSQIPKSVTCWDIYVAINAQCHDYIKLFRSWFKEDELNNKIIESAMSFWFEDDDYSGKSKIWDYFCK